MTRDELLEKISKIEALFADTDYAGERQAAKDALDRLHAKLDTAPEEREEFQFSLPDPWKRQLFCALARKLGYEPYRMKRQRRTTVCLRIEPGALDRVLRPQFLELAKLLHDYLNDVTTDIITRGVHGNLAEAEEQPTLSLD